MEPQNDIKSSSISKSSPTPVSSDSGPIGYASLEPSDEISLKELIIKIKEWSRYLLSNWLMILLVAMIGGGLGLFYTYIKKEKYIAEISFIMDNQKPASMGIYGGLASQLGIGGTGRSSEGFFSGDNFFTLMKSRNMMQRLFLTSVRVGGKEITLIEYYIRVKKLRRKWKEENLDLVKVEFPVNSDPNKFTLEQNSLISSLHAEIIADVLFIGPRSKKEATMVIRVTSDNELFSKAFAELVSTEVSEFYISKKTDKIQRNLTILRQQADSVRREFNAAIQGVSASIDANPNPNLSRVRLAVPSKQREIDAQVNQTMLMELIKNIEMTKMTLSEETPLFQIIDHPVLPLPVSRPDRLTFMLLGTVVFGFSSILYFVIRRILVNLQI
jgi:hypothetical protein